MNARPSDAIKARVRLIDVAAQYAEVKPSGPGRSVCRCLCGQREDRHPSFMLYEDEAPERDHFHCFSCGRHGSVVDLVMLAEGCDFKAAIDQLHQRYLDGTHSEPIVQHRRITRPSRDEPTAPVSVEVQAVLEASTAHYQSALWRCAEQLAYLTAPGPKGRGLSPAIIERLRIGYAEGRSLARALHKSGVDLAIASHIGLLTSRGEMLRQRIVFPVTSPATRSRQDESGGANGIGNGYGAIAFLIGRATQPGQEPKYLGLPDGLVHKQPMVAGSFRRGVIIVEGPFDFAALMQWGLDADFGLIALLGTAHAKAVEWLTVLRPRPSVFLALDQDPAGQDAAVRLTNALTERGLSTVGLCWVDGKDCGELLQRGDRGRRVFEQVLDHACRRQGR